MFCLLVLPGDSSSELTALILNVLHCSFPNGPILNSLSSWAEFWSHFLTTLLISSKMSFSWPSPHWAQCRIAIPSVLSVHQDIIRSWTFLRALKNHPEVSAQHSGEGLQSRLFQITVPSRRFPFPLLCIQASRCWCHPQSRVLPVVNSFWSCSHRYFQKCTLLI